MTNTQPHRIVLARVCAKFLCFVYQYTYVLMYWDFRKEDLVVLAFPRSWEWDSLVGVVLVNGVELGRFDRNW